MVPLKSLNLLKQTSRTDCFPICFKNALMIFSIDIKSDIDERLDIFDNGVENCSPSWSKGCPERWANSLEKLFEEWDQAERSRIILDSSMNIQRPEPQKWAKYLLDSNIKLSLIYNPSEQKEVILEFLNKPNSIIICDIETNKSFNGTDNIKDFKHSVLLLGIEDEEILIHDPDPKITTLRQKLWNKKRSVEYFFSNDNFYYKPIPNDTYGDIKNYSFVKVSLKE